MSGAGIVDDLSGKEKILVVFLKMIFFLDIFGPFEEEDKSIDIWLNCIDEMVLIECVYFLYLYSRCPNFLDEFREHSWIRLDSAPLIEHLIISFQKELI